MTAPRLHRRTFLGLTAGVVSMTLADEVFGSAQVLGSTREAHLEARPAVPSTTAASGDTPLGLGSPRDGLLHIPAGYDPGHPAPLALMLHGAGRDAQRMRATFAIADEFGVVVVAPDSRGRTWDAIGGRIGPDADFIDAALRSVFARVRVDPARLAIGGFSDGASYALGLGLANGDLFSHVLALSPGYIPTPHRRGKPTVFVSHGTEDVVLPIHNTSRVIVPRLRAAGYSVAYREFDGPHQLLPEIAREAFGWLVA